MNIYIKFFKEVTAICCKVSIKETKSYSYSHSSARFAEVIFSVLCATEKNVPAILLCLLISFFLLVQVFLSRPLIYGENNILENYSI